MLIDWQQGKLLVKIHGNSGVRKIVIKGKTVTTNQKSDLVTISKSANNSVITIDYKSKTRNLARGEQGFAEYSFAIK
jgi:hypothetical protein